jgi:predicted small secreted protein
MGPSGLIQVNRPVAMAWPFFAETFLSVVALLVCTDGKEFLMTKTKTSRFIIISALLGAMTLVSACNTVEGVGEDTASVGRAIERTADDAK